MTQGHLINIDSSHLATARTVGGPTPVTVRFSLIGFLIARLVAGVIP
jgi:hypothetical protein